MLKAFCLRYLLLKNYNTEMVLHSKKRLKIYIMTHSWFSYLTSTRGIKEMHDNIVHHGVQHSVVDPDPDPQHCVEHHGGRCYHASP